MAPSDSQNKTQGYFSLTRGCTAPDKRIEWHYKEQGEDGGGQHCLSLSFPLPLSPLGSLCLSALLNMYASNILNDQPPALCCFVVATVYCAKIDCAKLPQRRVKYKATGEGHTTGLID